MAHLTATQFHRKLLTNKSFPLVESLAIHRAHHVHFPASCSFPNLKRLFFHECDKNTHYYCAHPTLFPKLSLLIVDGHPCQASFVYRILDAVRRQDMHLVISNQFESHWLRYGGKSDGILDLMRDGKVQVRDSPYFHHLFKEFTHELDVSSGVPSSSCQD